MPLGARRTSELYSEAFWNWLLTLMISDWRAPSNMPTGASAAPLAIAVRICSSEMPDAAMTAGSTSTRTAGCSAPLTTTSATPSTCDSRCTSTVSAAS